MRPFLVALSSGILFSFSLAASTNGFPSAWTIFSATFSQPEPPPVHAEYRASWNQHKWNENVSHIASGFIYNSPAHKKVRVDETFDSALGSSLFDYTNVTQKGVANRQWILSPAVASPAQCFQGYVNPAFPLISAELLIASGAVFGGVVEDPFVGSVATVCPGSLHYTSPEAGGY
jgi:hypothetical protein